MYKLFEYISSSSIFEKMLITAVYVTIAFIIYRCIGIGIPIMNYVPCDIYMYNSSRYIYAGLLCHVIYYIQML